MLNSNLLSPKPVGCERLEMEYGKYEVSSQYDQGKSLRSTVLQILLRKGSMYQKYFLHMFQNCLDFAMTAQHELYVSRAWNWHDTEAMGFWRTLISKRKIG